METTTLHKAFAMLLEELYDSKEEAEFNEEDIN